MYLVTRQAQRYEQTVMWDDLLSDLCDVSAPRTVPFNPANTRTYCISNEWQYYFRANAVICRLYQLLVEFNARHAELIASDLSKHYRYYKIPKHSGGLRQISEPDTELMNAQRELKTLLETEFGVLYHTGAYAYVRGRSTIDAVKKHQANESNWFLKTDFKDFFGSTTPDFVLDMFSRIWPFNGICKYAGGREQLRRALSVCFLNGGLPQGSPISPLVTNVMMIPIDYQLSASLRNFHHAGKDYRMVYTRYADDMMISCQIAFDPSAVTELINTMLSNFRAPFRLHPDKTRYSGRTWMLGVRITQQGEISVGRKRRRQLEAMICNFIRDCRSGVKWPLGDLQHLTGLVSYYKMVEPENIKSLIDGLDEKFGVDSRALLKREVASA